MIVTKAVNMAEKMSLPIVGIIENMSYVECPDCHNRIYLFGESHIDEVAKKHGLSVLAKIPVDPSTGNVPEGIAAQAEWSCKNVGAILEAAGVGFENVVKTTCFLADMGDFAAFNEVYAKYFVSKPARSCVAVKALPKGVLCEIEAIAEK